MTARRRRTSIIYRFIIATELPTHRHSHRLKDIVEILTGDATTLSRLFSVFESPSGNWTLLIGCNHRHNEHNIVKDESVTVFFSFTYIYNLINNSHDIFPHKSK